MRRERQSLKLLKELLKWLEVVAEVERAGGVLGERAQLEVAVNLPGETVFCFVSDVLFSV